MSKECPTSKGMMEVVDQIIRTGQIDHSSLKQLRSYLKKTGETHQETPEQAVAGKNLDKDVGRNLLQLLGGTGLSRKDSAPSSVLGTENFSLNAEELEAIKNEIIEEDTVVPISMMLEVERVLGMADEWNFDPFQLSEVTEGHPLSSLTFWLLQRSGVSKKYGLDLERLSLFLRRVEEGYPSNPYHNAVHAADVVQSLHLLMTKGGVANSIGGKLYLLCAYIGGAIHDFEHRGFNNDFLIKTQNSLALQYNDVSPQENHHLSAAFSLVSKPEYNFWMNIPKAKMVRIRKILIDMVLATDMKQHFSVLTKFQSKFHVTLEDVNDATSPMMMIPELEQEVPRVEDEADKSLVLQVALKVADIGHITVQWETHLRWVNQLEEEFFMQGDAERQHGLRISPLMNRQQNGITKSQVGFFDVVAMPLFRTFTRVFPATLPMLDGAEENYCLWKEIEKL